MIQKLAVIFLLGFIKTILAPMTFSNGSNDGSITLIDPQTGQSFAQGANLPITWSIDAGSDATFMGAMLTFDLVSLAGGPNKATPTGNVFGNFPVAAKQLTTATVPASLQPGLYAVRAAYQVTNYNYSPTFTVTAAAGGATIARSGEIMSKSSSSVIFGIASAAVCAAMV